MNLFFRPTRLALCAVIATLSFSSAYAQLTEDGYYRVENVQSHRYVYVLDNKGSIDFHATTADLGALELWTGEDRAVSDPATVIYMTAVDSKRRDFDFKAQGTGVVEMIDYPVSVQLVSGTTDQYRIFGRNSGVTRYIGDDAEYEGEKGRMGSTQPANSAWVKWHIHPIHVDNPYYFGVTPTITVGEKHYCSFFAEFPFTPVSEGMSVFYVSKVDLDKGVAVIKPVEGTVPAATPVIIRTTSALPSGNKLNLGGTAGKITDNVLKGVYFKNESYSHNNVTTYDKETMRLFGTAADGSLAFVTTEDKYLPRNKAYISVPAGAPAELKLMTEEEYITAIDYAQITAARVSVSGLTVSVDCMESGAVTEVFTLSGQSIYRGTDRKISLPAPGVYLVNVGGRSYKIVAR